MSSRGARFGRLPFVRLCALLLFVAALVLPVLVVLSRQASAFSSSSEGVEELESFLGGAGGGGLASRASLQPPLDAAGTPVLVFVARERGTALEVHVPRPAEGERSSACAGETQAGEAVHAAALRVLRECARLGGPPDVEFLLRVGGAAAEEEAVEDGGAASYVALVRSEKLRGAKELLFQPLEGVVASAQAEPDSFDPHFVAALPAISKLLAPYAATAGRPGGACGPPGGR